MEPHDPHEKAYCKRCQRACLMNYQPQGDRLRATCAVCGAWVKWARIKGSDRTRIETMKKWYREMSPADRYAFGEWIEELETDELEAA